MPRTIRNPQLLVRLWPTMVDIVDWHVRGTRYGIGVDPEDGLLRAGEPGVQLTWMDAKVGDWVVTPRIGKPVEINALWHNALCVMARMADVVGDDGRRYAEMAEKCASSFPHAFVRPDGKGLYDVIAPAGPDASIRPNQIFAVSLPHSPLAPEHWKAVVDTVAAELVTLVGVRTLAPGDPAYRPIYGGNPVERDGAYHQGTVWPWLLGPFAEAHYRAYGDAEQARHFLAPLPACMADYGVGSLPEVYDADEPRRPNGCIAQAWSVAETLRVWKLLSAVDAKSATAPE
jgi:predicted glycogen debranching enzyme